MEEGGSEIERNLAMLDEDYACPIVRDAEKKLFLSPVLFSGAFFCGWWPWDATRMASVPVPD